MDVDRSGERAEMIAQSRQGAKRACRARGRRSAGPGARLSGENRVWGSGHVAHHARAPAAGRSTGGPPAHLAEVT
jgi:hypothetical protein